MSARTQEELDWLYLMICAGDVGPQALRELMETFGSPSDILNAGRRSVARIIGQEASKGLFSDERKTLFETTCSWLDKTVLADVVTWSDADYPKALMSAGKAPSVLWIRGRRELLTSPMVLVTGTEHPDKEGEQNAFDFAKALSSKENAVVSGLMPGVETSAIKGALDAGANAVVVAATGLDRLYPKQNRDLFVRIASEGLIISALPLGTVFQEERLGARLELMTALSQRTLIVQAEIGARALQAARTAAELGRDVYAIPGSIHSPLYKGNTRLLKQGAQLVESVADILC